MEHSICLARITANGHFEKRSAFIGCGAIRSQQNPLGMRAGTSCHRSTRGATKGRISHSCLWNYLRMAGTLWRGMWENTFPATFQPTARANWIASDGIVLIVKHRPPWANWVRRSRSFEEYFTGLYYSRNRDSSWNGYSVKYRKKKKKNKKLNIKGPLPLGFVWELRTM